MSTGIIYKNEREETERNGQLSQESVLNFAGNLPKE